MNKKFFTVLTLALFCSACFWSKSKSSNEPVAEPVAQATEVSAADGLAAPREPETTADQVQPQSAPSHTPQATAAQEPKTVTAPQQTSVTPAAPNKKLAASESTPPSAQDNEQSQVQETTDTQVAFNTGDTQVAFNADTAARLIEQKRAQQTLSSPTTDTAIFEEEPIIPVKGRRLSPLAYEPLQKDNSTAQWRGEQLKFGVYYSFIKAGTAYIKNRGLTEVNGRKAFLIQTTAFSASAINAVFKVRDINYSWIDAETFKSLGYMQSLREGNYVRDEWLTFDIANKRYYGEVQKKEEPRVIAGEMTEEVLDMLSSLYYVRTQPLEIGKDIIFDIINREKQYPLVVKVLKQETIKTSAGKFKCWVVEPKFRGEGIFVAKGKSLKVWLTADEYKMPVKMQAEVFIGSVRAELLEYKRN